MIAEADGRAGRQGAAGAEPAARVDAVKEHAAGARPHTQLPLGDLHVVDDDVARAPTAHLERPVAAEGELPEGLAPIAQH